MTEPIPPPENEAACCDIWVKAQEAGTDNEEYGSLVCWYLNRFWSMGEGLPPPRFCPWCGAVKKGKVKA